MQSEKKEFQKDMSPLRKSNSREDILNDSIDEAMEKYDTPLKESKINPKERDAISKKLNLDDLSEQKK